MTSTLVRIARALALAAVLAPLSFAQTSAAALYRLNERAAFLEGCYPPCRCLLAQYDDLFGTFSLKPTGTDPQGFTHYAVGNVNWTLTYGGTEVRITGGGEYVTGGLLIEQQRLELDLSFDDAAPVHFDSGLVPGGGVNPLAIDVAQNGFYCFDRVFSIDASPVSADEIVPYQLHHSVYDEGCFDPCDCLLQEWRISGTFGLLDLRPTFDPLHKPYAVLHANWSALSIGPAPGRSWSGSGIWISESGGAQQRMTLDLKDQDGTLRRYKSGLVANPTVFPEISVDVAVNDFFCFDYAFFLNAIPQ